MLIPRFQITNKTLLSVASIEAAGSVMDLLPLVPVWELRLREEALVKQIHYILKPEGNKLSLGEVEKIVKEEPLRNETPKQIINKIGIPFLESDVQEAMNLRNALKITDQWVVMQHKRGGDVVYSKEQLLQVQVLTMEKLVEASEIGKWRNMAVSATSIEGEVLRPANVVEVPYQIDDLFSWLNTREARQIHPVLKAAIVDLELTRIQPFKLGSDRVTKVFVAFCLAAEGVSKKRIVSFEEVREKEIKSLYRLVAEAGRLGMLTNYIDAWSEILLLAMNKARQKVERLSVDTQVRSKTGHQISLNERQIKLIEFLEANSWVTLTQVRRVLSDVSDDTILRDLKDLIKKGLVKKKGRTKGAKYGLKSQV